MIGLDGAREKCEGGGQEILYCVGCPLERAGLRSGISGATAGEREPIVRFEIGKARERPESLRKGKAWVEAGARSLGCQAASRKRSTGESGGSDSESSARLPCVGKRTKAVSCRGEAGREIETSERSR